ncbi:MAG: copper amine oxidase N-terminal domain-containing protein, partial [Lachnospiraceae bacterium]|nr:copper amine oxidase N-terminal domain-containing protein [Lachnospiraceae bacterium]
VENGTVKNNYVTTSDPGFVDLENGNYTLKEDAEVFTKITDFMPIPFTRMGNCIDRAMQRIIPATVIAIDSPYAFVNGELQTIDGDLSVKPKIYNDRTYLPLRFLAEANGFDVDYDAETKTAHLKNQTGEMYVNIENGEISVNGETKEPIEPIIVANRTLLPLRAISELLHKQIFWDDIGFISISDIENLFDSQTDDEIIDYLHSQMSVY